MPCPYAVRKGPLVYCKLANKKVNPLAYPCLGNKYNKCKIYKKYSGKKEEVKAEKQPEQKPEPKTTQPPQQTKPPEIQKTVPEIKLEIPKIEIEGVTIPVKKEEKTQTRGERRTRGMTIDGKPARDCLECIYYGRNTRICLLLGVEVKDPTNPPCAST